MRTLPLLALVPMLALACSPQPPEVERRIVYEVAPEHAAAIVAVLQARLGPSNTVAEAQAGRVHVDLREGDDEALVRRIAETPGRLRFLIGAEGDEEPPGGWKRAYDLLDLWCRAHPLEPLSGAPTPIEGSAWVLRAGAPAEAEVEERAVLVLEPTRPEWRFETPPLARVAAGEVDPDTLDMNRRLGFEPGTGRFEFPTISLELDPERQADFGAFTGAHLERPLAVVLDEEAILVARIGEPLSGTFHLRTGFTDEQLDVYVPVLRHGRLPAPVRYVETRAVP